LGLEIDRSIDDHADGGSEGTPENDWSSLFADEQSGRLAR